MCDNGFVGVIKSAFLLCRKFKKTEMICLLLKITNGEWKKVDSSLTALVRVAERKVLTIM